VDDLKNLAFTLMDSILCSWRALLFYLYTGNIQFRPLKSKPSEFSVGICDSLAVDPETCSPKSMYRLADKVSDLTDTTTVLTFVGESRLAART